MLQVLCILLIFYGFVFLITKRQGLATYLFFNTPAILAMFVGLAAQYFIGLRISGLTLTLIPLFCFLSVLMFFFAVYSTDRNISLRRIYLKRVNYFQKMVRSVHFTLVSLFISTCAYAYYEMFSNGIFFREFYRNLVGNNGLILITAASSIGVTLCLYYFLEKKYIFAIIIMLILVSFGKKSPVFVIALLSITHLFFSNRNLIIPIFIGVTSLILVAKLASIQANVDITILTQIASTFDYVVNFDYFVKHFTMGELNGQIFLSEFIRYIPRLIWEQKPTIYGPILIHEKLYPAQLATGYTPGIFSHYARHLADFGMLGFIPFSINAFLHYFLFLKAGNFIAVCVLCYNIDNTLLPILFLIVFIRYTKQKIYKLTS